MPDLRLPFANASAAGLWPDLATIRADMGAAAAALHEQLLEKNPLLAGPYDPSDLTTAQRALGGVFLIDYYVAPFEWLSHLLDVARGSLPLILWSAREVDLGRTTECIERDVRLNGGDPDALVKAYSADPQIKVDWKRQQVGADPSRLQCMDWWSSDAAQADFNRRVFDYAFRHLSGLIAPK